MQPSKTSPPSQNFQNHCFDMLCRILRAKVYDVALETPLELAKNISQKLKQNIYFKREDLQPVFSFKIRGAYNKMANLAPHEKQGVIAASAGNHAQGVALSAAHLKIKALIVMPITTPEVKINAVRGFGGEWVEIVLHGTSYQEAYQKATELQTQFNYTFVHPFDDKDVIAGQGTIAVEILKQFPPLLPNNAHEKIQAIFLAIGGGGLITGIASYIKAIAPEIKIIGVQAVDSNAMQQSILAKEIITLPQVGLFSDGTAVKTVGQHTFEFADELIDDIILVDTDQICAAIKDIFEDTRSIVEPAGALALAGLKQYVAQKETQPKAIEQTKPENLVVVTCGANMNFDRLRFVAERAQMGEAKEAIFAVTLAEKPGSLKHFCKLIGQHHITEFNYRYAHHPKSKAHIFVGMHIHNSADLNALEQQFKDENLEYINLTHDEISKLHIRHMVGGVAHLPNEHLIHVEFPERPRALLDFLENVQANWNISLFHYRNHGADYSKVLLGVDVPEEEKATFTEFLKQLSYPYQEVENHPAYRLFLS